jgi:flagellar protein FlaD
MKGNNKGNIQFTSKELEDHLQELVEKKFISDRVAKKIFQKINEKGITLNEKELNTLIKTIQKITVNQVDVNTNSKQIKKSLTNKQTFDQNLKQSIDASTETIKELNHELTNIENRIENIEVNQKHIYEDIHHDDQKIREYPSSSDDVFDHDMEPLLEIRNTPENVVVLMRWLQYLIDKLGQNNLSEMLDYYVNINWISEDVRLDLIKYAKGISFQDHMVSNEKAKPTFSIDDHLQSFLFIQKLKGTTFQEDFLVKVNCKIDKMGKTIQRQII